MAGVIRNNKLQQLDTFLFFKCHLVANLNIQKLSVWVSKTGDGYGYFVIAALLYFLDPNFGAAFFLTALVAYAFEVPIYLSLKNLVKRNRPFDKIAGFESHIAPSDKFSMPSGHTAAAFVFATVINNYYPELAALAYCWASIVGLSRILLGVHYPGDIIAGAALGYACAELAISIY